MGGETSMMGSCSLQIGRIGRVVWIDGQARCCHSSGHGSIITSQRIYGQGKEKKTAVSIIDVPLKQLGRNLIEEMEPWVAT